MSVYYLTTERVLKNRKKGRSIRACICCGEAIYPSGIDYDCTPHYRIPQPNSAVNCEDVCEDCIGLYGREYFAEYKIEDWEG